MASKKTQNIRKTYLFLFFFTILLQYRVVFIKKCDILFKNLLSYFKIANKIPQTGLEILLQKCKIKILFLASQLYAQ